MLLEWLKNVRSLFELFCTWTAAGMKVAVFQAFGFQIMRWLLEARDYKAQKCQQSLTGSEFIFSNWGKSKQVIYHLCIIKLTSGCMWHRMNIFFKYSHYKRNLFQHMYYWFISLFASYDFHFHMGIFCCNGSCSREEIKKGILVKKSS